MIVAKKVPTKRERKRFLPGMAPASVPKLDVAANDYYDLVREKMAMQAKEEDSKKEIARGIFSFKNINLLPFNFEICKLKKNESDESH